MKETRRRIVPVKRAPAIAVSALGCVLLASGCGGGEGGSAGGGSSSGTVTAEPVVLRDAANHTTVHVAAGREVELLLSSGYWHVVGSSARSVLSQDGDTRVLPRPSSCPNIPGLGCAPEETLFTALAPGKAVITASRTSCGEAEPCQTYQASFSVTVVVG